MLESTETAVVQEALVVADRLHDLRRLGVRLATDDFGVGYSSLSYLRQFPIDILKIDRSFVSSINERDSIPAIVRGLIEVGRTLDLEIVAEGIEEATRRDQLRRGGCDLAQGFYFARPMHEDDAERLVADVASSGSDEDARVRVRRSGALRRAERSAGRRAAVVSPRSAMAFARTGGQDVGVRLAGHYGGEAILESGTRRTPVSVELFIELDELEPEDPPAGSYRTWVGRITAGDVDGGTLMFEPDLQIELPSGRRASCAVIEDLRIVGLGDPPFD